VSEERRPSISCLIGACWGAGHTVALLVAGAAIMAFELTVPRAVERGVEMAVALLLVALGGQALVRVGRAAVLHRHRHSHGGHAHSHFHLHLGDRPHEAPGHVHLMAVGGRPFLVGILHGLAGSAALVLIVLGAIRSLPMGLLYILVFGVGSTVGMLVLSGLIGLPFALTSARAPAAYLGIQALAGAVSLLLGVLLASRLG
jgi:hypothetical protein